MSASLQETLFEAMSTPDFYPHPVQSVRQEDTHISKVFLTGELVYKIKKNVDLGFLDFSSLAKRRRACELEVSLNRRLTGNVYRGVIPITSSDGGFCMDGSGSPVEYAVCMRQLPDTCSMAWLLKHHRISVAQVNALADLLVEFYTRQGAVAPVPASASWENIVFACEENFRQTQWARGRPLNALRYDAVKAGTRSFLSRRKALFIARSDDEKIFDGHGDLRCSHIYYTRASGIQVIDCIEFNTRLRYIDSASDLAFLVMDLDYRGAPELGAALVDRYVRRTRDWQVYALLPFYKCYRSMVRCKVNCIRLKERNPASGDASAHAQKANQYLSLADRYAGQFNRPTLWVFCGLPATGKSTLAGQLSKAMDIDRWRSDIVRKKLFKHNLQPSSGMGFQQGIYTPAAHDRTYEKLLEPARKALAMQTSVILDATFSRPAQRRKVLRLAADGNARVVFIECTAPDHVLKKRLLQRENRPSASDARSVHFDMLKARYVSPDEVDADMRLKVDTTQPVHECLREVLSWHGRAAPASAGDAEKTETVISGKGGNHVQNHSGGNRPYHRA